MLSSMYSLSLCRLCPNPCGSDLAYFVPCFDELKLQRCVTRVVICVCVVTCTSHLLFFLCVFVWWAIVFQLSQAGLRSVPWFCSLVGDHLLVVEAFIHDIISYTWSSCVFLSCVNLVSAHVLLVWCGLVNVSNCLVFCERWRGLDVCCNVGSGQDQESYCGCMVLFKMSCVQFLWVIASSRH